MANSSYFDGIYDAAVVGGGPAGATLATFLARSGRRCLILEHSKFPRYHIGESLIPHTYGTFKKLGLLPKLKASNYPVKHSVRFVSRSGKESTPFYFSDTVPGERARTWQVDRSNFDLMMLDTAREAGVETREKTNVDSVIFKDGRAIGLTAIREGEEKKEVRARVIIDASGRSTLIGSQLGLRGEVPGLKKASVWSYYRGGLRLPGIDEGETTIFLIPGGGWFWYIPLPHDVVSVGIVASPEYLFANTENQEENFLREVSQCQPLAERLADASFVGPIRGLSQLAYLNRQTCGDGWVMIGDARAFLDPIYSSGLFLALASAELAAQSINEALLSDDVSALRLGSFETKLSAGLEVVRRLIYAFYDPQFSFREFVERYPHQRAALIDCFIGDVLKDMTSFTDALAEMTSDPPPL